MPWPLFWPLHLPAWPASKCESFHVIVPHRVPDPLISRRSPGLIEASRQAEHGAVVRKVDPSGSLLGLIEKHPGGAVPTIPRRRIDPMKPRQT